jgi:hypothetical protein
MKTIKINSLATILFIFLIFGVAFLLPIVLIETLWNSTVANSFNATINLWQALILWLMVLVILNIIGVFKFEFAVEAIDEEAIKKKIDGLK